MRVFDNPQVLREVLGSHKKWQRTIEAIDAAPSLVPGAMYSIGDSLTYRTDRTERLATAALIGRRRYHFVVVALDGQVAVEVAPKADCEPASGYSDLTDRQEFIGTGRRILIPEGGLLVVDIDEAARILPDPDATAVLLHVTVEGATFHNK